VFFSYIKRCDARKNFCLDRLRRSLREKRVKGMAMDGAPESAKGELLSSSNGGEGGARINKDFRSSCKKGRNARVLGPPSILQRLNMSLNDACNQLLPNSTRIRDLMLFPVALTFNGK